tara:strand:+ start:1446 stop:1799 length:354 start_codon:yes stop_codon:yes gene_type:complete
MEYRLEQLRAEHRHLYGEPRKGKSSRKPCQDYVNEKKLIRMIKNSIDEELINQLRRLDYLGSRSEVIEQNLIDIVEHKIPKLDGKEIRNHIERIEKNSVFACVREIIGREEQNESDN